jgi:hypothetical protein
VKGIPSFGRSPQQDAYTTFVEGILSDDDAKLASVVDASTFTAHLPGHGNLTLEQFRAYTRNLLGASPDFGQDTTMLQFAENDNVVAVLYEAAYTVAGNPVTQLFTDWVTYNNQGEITELRVIFDLAGAQIQAFGETAPRRSM